MERCQLGREGAARKGVWPSTPKYGWMRVHPSKALVVDEAKAAVIRQAFQDAIQGRNIRDITARAGWFSHVATIKRLRDPAYKGEAVYAGIVVPVPAIVSAEDWQRARDAIWGRRRNRAGGKAPGAAGA